MIFYLPTLEDLQTAYSEITKKWEKLYSTIDAFSGLANKSVKDLAVKDLAYVDGVYHEGTDEYKMYNKICEIAEYLEKFSRYF